LAIRRILNGGEKNPFASLELSPKQIEVVTDAGNYACDGKTFLILDGQTHDSQKTKLVFSPDRLIFTSNKYTAYDYWVLPLENFITKFAERSQATDRHPLRIFPTPELPQGLEGRELFSAEISRNEKNNLILFSIRGSSIYIESLPDFADREHALQQGEARRRITSLAVGSVDDRPVDSFASIKSWLPLDLHLLLAFACGNEVGFPWIEFRDSNANLVRRIYVNFRTPCWELGHQALDGLRAPIGPFLITAFQAHEFQKTYFRVLLQHAVEAASNSVHIERRFSCVFSAFECMVNEFNLKRRNKVSQLRIEDQETLNRINAAAREDLKKLRNEAKRRGDLIGAEVIDFIISKMANVASVESDFGQSFVSLLEQLGLADAQAIEKELKHKPRLDGRSWPQLLSFYRNTVVHEAYFDLDMNREEDLPGLVEAFQSTQHLYDLLLRMLLLLIGFKGKYMPQITEFAGGKPIDWVTSDTPLSELGYRSS
jgi:hypothetical protein